MIFEKRLAKIGRGNNVNLYPKSDTFLEVFILINSIVKKDLDISNESYKLQSSLQNFLGREIIKLDNDLFVIRSANNIYLEMINEENN